MMGKTNDGGNMCVRLTLTALIALIAFGPGVSAQGSYPEPAEGN
jgi:hypothetical protein